MYCKIKNRECPHAGEVKVSNGLEIESYTICYNEGGRLACSLGI